jgi:hypothetical protein
MVVVAHLKLAGFFDLVTDSIANIVTNPWLLLALVVTVQSPFDTKNGYPCGGSPGNLGIQSNVSFEYS